MPKIPEFLQQIVNEACDEKSLPSGNCIDQAELTMPCPFLFHSDLNKDTPEPAQNKTKPNQNENKTPPN